MKCGRECADVLRFAYSLSALQDLNLHLKKVEYEQKHIQSFVLPQPTCSKGILHGYTLRKGNVIIKASELRGRAFMVSRLEDTWRRLHAQKNTYTQVQKTQRTSTVTNTDNSGTTTPKP